MNFDKKAPAYHDKANMQREVADWAAEWIDADCADLEAVELGAGTGLFTRHLALRDFRKLRATDVSRAMIAEGQRRIPFVEWEELDAWTCGIERPVDRLYACSLLQWAENPANVLKNWSQSINTGGKFLGCLFIDGSLREFASLVGSSTGFVWRSDLQWLELFELAGLRVARYETRSDTAVFESARAALRSVHDVGATFAPRMGAVDLRRRLRRLDSRGDSQFRISWSSLRIECVKDGEI